MLGDLVYVAHNGKASHFGKVTALLPSGAVETEIEGSLALSSSVEPIPLTAEILEKNGFRQDKKCPFVYETDDEDVIIDLYDPDPNARLSKKEDYDKMVGVRLSPSPPYGFRYWGRSLMIRANYVHELQHALRICGIEKEIVL